MGIVRITKLNLIIISAFLVIHFIASLFFASHFFITTYINRQYDLDQSQIMNRYNLFETMYMATSQDDDIIKELRGRFSDRTDPDLIDEFIIACQTFPKSIEWVVEEGMYNYIDMEFRESNKYRVALNYDLDHWPIPLDYKISIYKMDLD